MASTAAQMATASCQPRCVQGKANRCVAKPTGTRVARLGQNALRQSFAKYPAVKAGNPRIKRACASAAAEAQADPTTTGLIFGPGIEGSWDESSVGAPVVRNWVIDGEQRWVMWYGGATPESPSLGPLAPVSGSIGVAISSDGVNWSRGSGSISGGREQEMRDADVGKIMEPNEDWWWMDTCHLAAADVQVFSDGNTGSGVFWMFYQGADYEAVPVPEGLKDALGEEDLEGMRLRPGLAMSQDGKNWARIEGDHHTGALFDVGEEGEWDHLFIAHPQVVAVGPKEMRMYYHSFDPADQCWKVGLAVSESGFRWTKKGVIFQGKQAEGSFDAKGAAARHVVRNPDNGDYLMFYEAVAADNSRSIGLAVSKNGITGWERCDEAILTASDIPGSWDEGGVGAPRAIPMANSWRLYYSGRGKESSSWEGIGLALSDEDGAPKLKGVATNFKRRTGGN